MNDAMNDPKNDTMQDKIVLLHEHEHWVPSWQAQNPPSQDVNPADEPETIEQWDAVALAVKMATANNFEISPQGVSLSIEAFKKYWSGIYKGLAEEVKADDSIPLFLTDPPVKEFRISLIRRALGDLWPRDCCCRYQHNGTQIELVNENGVTKNDFVEGFAKYMYGEGQAMPTVWLEGIMPFKAFALVYDREWAEGKFVGPPENKWVAWVSAFPLADRKPTVVYYCCEPDEFLDREAEVWMPDPEDEDDPIFQ